MSGKKLRKSFRKNLKRDERFREKKHQRKKLRTKRRFTNIHHVIPRSRCQEFGVDPENKRNKIVVDKRKHDIYHQLVGNMTPEEAFNYLLRTFWNGMIAVPVKFQKGNFEEDE